MAKKKNPEVTSEAEAAMAVSTGIPEGAEPDFGEVDDTKKPGEPNRPQFSNPGEISVVNRTAVRSTTPSGNVRVDF